MPYFSSRKVTSFTVEMEYKCRPNQWRFQMEESDLAGEKGIENVGFHISLDGFYGVYSFWAFLFPVNCSYWVAVAASG